MWRSFCRATLPNRTVRRWRASDKGHFRALAWRLGMTWPDFIDDFLIVLFRAWNLEWEGAVSLPNFSQLVRDNPIPTPRVLNTHFKILRDAVPTLRPLYRWKGGAAANEGGA